MLTIHFGDVHGTTYREPAGNTGKSGSPNGVPDRPGQQRPGSTASPETAPGAAAPASKPRSPGNAGHRIGNDVRSMSTTQSTGSTHAQGAVLPDRYIAHPNGDLRSDTENPGILIDERGRRYMQSNGNLYGITRGKDQGEANGTWRLIVHDEPVKPGIPVKQNADGRWTLQSDVGLQGGHRSAADKANLQASVQATRSALQSNRSNNAVKLQELDRANADVNDARRQKAELERKKDRITHDLNDARSQAQEYQLKSEQSRRDTEDAQKRYDRAQSSANTDLPFGVGELWNTGQRLHSVFEDASTVDTFRFHQQQNEDEHRKWTAKALDYQRGLTEVENDHRRVADSIAQTETRISNLHSQVRALEHEHRSLDRELADLERELAGIEREHPGLH
ncbi:hypothetical protein KZJ38_13115 [Paraburkholderia edwinii]|uniref:Uncharacterized protein n=1 Tax=Paraburkholderia edwinii TaxID=2861782 RepID=A0ABX8UGE9_9BURK|nr:hypothetical protein [Paraburkholderia edwinii]QYD67312.1 hypothetical protein KZJ38_13115 [Paraburkholderia edwinii]